MRFDNRLGGLEIGLALHLGSRSLGGRFLGGSPRSVLFGRSPSSLILGSSPCGFVLNRSPLSLLLGRPSCGFRRSTHRSSLGGAPCYLFGSSLTGSFLCSSSTRSLLRSSSTRSLLRSSSTRSLLRGSLTRCLLRSPTHSLLRFGLPRGLLGLDPRCLLGFGLPCSLLLGELRTPFRLLGVDRVALREDLPLVRQALDYPLRFASPVHVVDAVSPTPDPLHSPKGGDLPMRRRGLASGSPLDALTHTGRLATSVAKAAIL